MTRAKKKGWLPRGFTLIELLVALAVLALLFAVLAQVVAMTGQAISVNTKKLEATAQARLVFDRLAKDLSARPNRSDLKLAITKSSGNDSLQFYSQVNGYTVTPDPMTIRGLAAIGYQIPTTPLIPSGPVHQLERGATGIEWLAGAGNSQLDFQALPSPKNADYDVLGNGVFRLEICYLLNTGVFSNSNGSTNINDYSRVKAIVVGLAVLDTASRKIFSTATNTHLKTLSDALKDTEEGQDPLTQWTANMEQQGFASGVPAQAIQGVRLYQRMYNVY